jgi:alanine transaminase
MPVKALVVINPGNPTGNCLSEEDMQAIIRVCYDNNIVLLADEVYQENVFDPENKPFHSFKKVLSSMGGPYATDVGLISFHSISKGYSGECGRRGGFMELVNIDEDVLTQINKISSVGLCPPASGQIGVDCLVRPPKEGGPSYAQWREETEGIKNALRDRSLFMGERFAKLDGMSCQKAEVCPAMESFAPASDLADSFLLVTAGRHVPLPSPAAAREGDPGRQGGRAVARPLLLPCPARCVVV